MEAKDNIIDNKDLKPNENKKDENNEKEENNQVNENKTENNEKLNIKEDNNQKENIESNVNQKDLNNEEINNETKQENTIPEKPNLYEESSEPFMQIASKELISCLNEPENRKCFDCDTSPANWICVNNSIFLCGKCAGEHRGYGTIISDLKFMMLDKLNEFQIEIMKRGGNKKLDKLLGEYNIDKNKMDKLLLYSSRLLEYHRDYLYNQLAGKEAPKPPNKFDSTKIMNNFKEIKRPPLEKVKVNNNEIIEENKNQNKDNKKGNCKVQ